MGSAHAASVEGEVAGPPPARGPSPCPGGALLVVGPPGLRHSIQQRPWQTEGTDSTAPPRGLTGEGRSGRMLAVVDNGWPRRRGWGWWGGCGVCLPFVSDQLHHRPHNLRRKRKESEQTGARPLPSPMLSWHLGAGLLTQKALSRAPFSPHALPRLSPRGAEWGPSVA